MSMPHRWYTSSARRLLFVVTSQSRRQPASTAASRTASRSAAADTFALAQAPDRYDLAFVAACGICDQPDTLAVDRGDECRKLRRIDKLAETRDHRFTPALDLDLIGPAAVLLRQRPHLEHRRERTRC